VRPRLAALVTAWALAGCGEAGGPHARIRALTGCEVPPGVVRLHDEVGGTAAHAVTHAKLVMPESSVEAFVTSCGFTMEELEVGFDHHELQPETPLAWWNPPDRRLLRGARHVTAEGERVLLMLERDTDFAFYVYAADR